MAALLVFILAIYQARRMTQPISQLVSASKAVAAGKLEQQVIVTTDNEIGELAQSFNHMLEVRNRHDKALKISNQQAEQALSDLAMQKFALDQHSIVAVTDVSGTITFVNDKAKFNVTVQHFALMFLMNFVIGHFAIFVKIFEWIRS